METNENTPVERKVDAHNEPNTNHDERRVYIDVENNDGVDVVVKNGEIDVVVKDEHGETTTIAIHTEHGHDHGHHGGGDHPPHHVEEIFVNEKPVPTHAHELTGLQIKQAAIAVGIAIQLDFVLAEEREGTSHIVGDNDTVKLHNKMHFSAIRDDDNS
jgi:hypothetical protein